MILLSRIWNMWLCNVLLFFSPFQTYLDYCVIEIHNHHQTFISAIHVLRIFSCQSSLLNGPRRITIHDFLGVLFFLAFSSIRCSGGFKGGQGGHGPRPRTFGNAEGVPHLRKNWKDITGKHLNLPLWHKNFNEKNLKNNLGLQKIFKQGPRRWIRPQAPQSLKPPRIRWLLVISDYESFTKRRGCVMFNTGPKLYSIDLTEKIDAIYLK